MTTAKNVFSESLQPCSVEPLTGFYRDGCCNTGAGDAGLHLVCAQMTAEFLEYTRSRGNDLTTPNREFGFPGLKPGDRWCLCVERWKEANDAGVAPRVIPQATHISALEFVDLDTLLVNAVTE
jgi:uncharacterized protein (DUF2237 family)